jgi:hypothetical protein
MNIKLNYVSLQNGTMFSLLDLVHRSWTMCLNFGSIVLSLPNLIRTKDWLVKFNLSLEMGD